MYKKMIKRRIISIVAAMVFLVAISGCSYEEEGSVYMNIGPKEAKKLMEELDEFIKHFGIGISAFVHEKRHCAFGREAGDCRNAAEQHSAVCKTEAHFCITLEVERSESSCGGFLYLISFSCGKVCLSCEISCVAGKTAVTACLDRFADFGNLGHVSTARNHAEKSSA